MRTYTLVVARAGQVLFQDDVPFFGREKFSRLIGLSLEDYAIRSGVDLEDDDVIVSVSPKHEKPS